MGKQIVGARSVTLHGRQYEAVRDEAGAPLVITQRAPSRFVVAKEAIARAVLGGLLTPPIRLVSMTRVGGRGP